MTTVDEESHYKAAQIIRFVYTGLPAWFPCNNRMHKTVPSNFQPWY